MTARIAFLGDTLLGGDAQPVLDEHGTDHAIAGIRGLWADADLVVANHEGPLTVHDSPATKLDTGKKRYWYKGHPDSARTLAAAGVRMVSLANNHILDFGAEGLLDTMNALETAGITHCGAGENDDAAREPAVADVAGLRVGFLSVMQRYNMYVDDNAYATKDQPGPARLRPSRLAADIAALHERVDLCIVLVHWGRNYKDRTSLQEKLAHGMQQAGADLIIGHHPHIPHPVTILDGVPVVYSLGNAAFGTPGRYHDGRPPYGLIAIAEVERHRVTGLELHLIQVNNAIVNYQPQPAFDAEARAYLRTLYDPVQLASLATRGAAGGAAASDLAGRRVSRTKTCR